MSIETTPFDPERHVVECRDKDAGTHIWVTLQSIIAAEHYLATMLDAPPEIASALGDAATAISGLISRIQAIEETLASHTRQIDVFIETTLKGAA